MAAPTELREALGAVVATWPRSESSRVSPVDLTRAGDVLLAAVTAALRGEPLVLEGIPPFVPARRLLDATRQGWLLGEHSQGMAADAVVQTMRAMDLVLRALDADATHRFVSRLGSLDAQQLVVEMAHDMRSPLGSILILAERLRSGPGGLLPAIQQRQVGLIYSAAFGLSTLAGDVIELARGGSTLLDVQPIPFSVSGVLQSIHDMLRPMAEEKHVALRWEGPRHNVRLGHPAALNRVLLNLATNAIKFTNVGEVVIQVTEPSPESMTFAVRDTGRGIPPSVMQHLFDAFRQRQTPGDYAFSSAGLGLSICQKLVRAMGGDLHVETALEQGTTFSFSLHLPPAGASPSSPPGERIFG
ncbi:MAG: HAMP domain-containing histidine kinase [Gemmatimonadetes bacterium]|nr:HAMP domain-containing histidine kinase [Gemmatimonadota bacterium]